MKDVEPGDADERVSGIVLFRLEGGKIVEGWHYHTIVEYAQQLRARQAGG